MNSTITLHSEAQARDAFAQAWRVIRDAVRGGKRMYLTVRPATRSLEQSAKLHAELTEIAREVPWAGRKRDVETWKRLMTAAWLRARGESVEILPALDGHGVDVVFRRTSDLTRAECSELLEFVLSWKAEHCNAEA